MQYSSTLVGHLVWPAVVIVAIVLFRREIATKILELKSLRSKLVGAEFEDAKGSIDSAIDEAKSAPKIHERSVTAGQIAGVQVRAEGEDDSSDAPFEVKDQEFDNAMIARSILVTRCDGQEQGLTNRFCGSRRHMDYHPALCLLRANLLTRT